MSELEAGHISDGDIPVSNEVGKAVLAMDALRLIYGMRGYSLETTISGGMGEQSVVQTAVRPLDRHEESLRISALEYIRNVINGEIGEDQDEIAVPEK